MSRTYFRDFKLDDGSPVCVAFDCRHLSTTHSEITVIDAWLKADEEKGDAPSVALNDAEDGRFQEEVCANIWKYIE